MNADEFDTEEFETFCNGAMAVYMLIGNGHMTTPDGITSDEMSHKFCTDKVREMLLQLFDYSKSLMREKALAEKRSMKEKAH